MPPRCDALLANADVLEVIAEHACATVADACSLRSASRGWRRAVDTTVRALVYVSQPALRTAVGASPVTLRLHEDGPHLDAVRIAFTCDRFPSIARLIVVAFALDGAKDELREGGVCGPRPVDCSQQGGSTGRRGLGGWFISSVADARQITSPAVAASLNRCCMSLLACDKKSVTDVLCTAAASDGALRSVTRLGAFNRPKDVEQQQRVNKLISALAPQLTEMHLGWCTKEMCGAIARCTSLRRIEVFGCKISPELFDSLCDALIASGAPLRSVFLELDRKVGGTAALRLLEAVQTIVEVRIHAMAYKELPPAVAARLEKFNLSYALPLSRRCEITQEAQPWTPSARVEALVVPCTAYGEVPLRVVDFATAFPNLRRLKLDEMYSWDPTLRAEDLRFPASLEFLSLDGAVAFEFGFLPQLSKRGHQLHSLLTVNIERPLGEGGSDAAKLFDISPLAAFASSLRSLYLGTWEDDDPVDVGAIEDTLSRLVALEDANVPSLPSARCFMHGAHRQLRVLTVFSVHEPSAGAPFHRLVSKCPRLVRATGGSTTANPSLSEAPGWSWCQDRRTALRVSFTEATLR